MGKDAPPPEGKAKAVQKKMQAALNHAKKSKPPRIKIDTGKTKSQIDTELKRLAISSKQIAAMPDD